VDRPRRNNTRRRNPFCGCDAGSVAGRGASSTRFHACREVRPDRFPWAFGSSMHRSAWGIPCWLNMRSRDERECEHEGEFNEEPAEEPASEESTPFSSTERTTRNHVNDLPNRQTTVRHPFGKLKIFLRLPGRYYCSRLRHAEEAHPVITGTS